MSASHPSDFLLERYVVLEVSSKEAEHVALHMLSCQVCHNKYTQLKTFSEQYLKERPASDFLCKINTQSQSIYGWRTVIQDKITAIFYFFRHTRMRYGFAMAALCVIGIFAIKQQDESEYRLKGSVGPYIQVYVKRQGNISMLRAQQKIRAQDALKIEIPTTQKIYAEVYIVESSKNITPYPQGPFFELSSTHQTLPNSLEITAPCHDMWILVNFNKRSSSMLPMLAQTLVQRGFSDATFKQLNVDDKIYLQCEANE